MRSSTSASNLRRAIWLLIAGCLGIGIVLEVAARVGLDRASRIQRRMVEEYQHARVIGQDGSQGHHLLMVGNSLLDEGVQFDRLRERLLESGCNAQRFMVEQTVYYDWYYGLRRLLNEGARPDVVVVMLGTGHWLSPNIRGDYSAQYLMSKEDLPLVARDLGMHPTQATGLFVAGLSKFWGARVEMRTFVLSRFMPELGRLMNFTAEINRRPMVAADITPVLRERIARMREVTDRYGVHLVLLVAPVLDPNDGSSSLVDAARAERVTVLNPVASGSLDAGLYRDGFHLNEAGAALFTDKLIPALNTELVQDGMLEVRSGK